MKTITDHRKEFEEKLVNEPDKLAAYQSAMDAVKGDWVSEVLTHWHFKCMRLGIPWIEEEKVAAREQTKT